MRLTRAQRTALRAAQNAGGSVPVVKPGWLAPTRTVTELTASRLIEAGLGTGGDGLLSLTPKGWLVAAGLGWVDGVNLGGLSLEQARKAARGLP